MNKTYPLAGALLGQGWAELVDGTLEGFYTYQRFSLPLHEHTTATSLRNALLEKGIPQPAYNEAIATFQSFLSLVETIDNEVPEGTEIAHLSAIAGKPIYEDTLDTTILHTVQLVDKTVRVNGILPQLDSYIELIKVALHYRAYQKSLDSVNTSEDIVI